MARPSHRSRPGFAGAVALVVAGVVLVGGLSGCSKDEFEDKTAVVAVGGSRQTYQVDSCLLDGQTVYVVARTDDGSIVQAVMGLEKDDETGIPASTGISIDFDPSSDETRVAAFGAEAWERRGLTGKPPGSITSARLRGSRIQFSGNVVPVDAKDVPVPNGEAQRFSLDARCDEAEE